MDDLTTKTSSQHATLSKPIRKGIPKFTGRTLSRPSKTMEAEKNNDKFQPPKSISLTDAKTPSRIPTKSTSFSKTPKPPIKSRYLPRSESSSTSNIRIVSEVESKTLDTTSSKLSLRSVAPKQTQSLKIPQPTKCWTARGPPPGSNARLSVSNISCRSARSARSPRSADNSLREDSHTSLLAPLTKVTSNAGDCDSHISARERVAENNKFKVFESLQKKLQDMQSDFMAKFESLKISSPEKLKSDYKFITLVRNNECKLIVRDDQLLKLPKKFPVFSVSDFKETMRSALESAYNDLFENLKNAQNDPSFNIIEWKNILEREKAHKFKDINDSINSLCSSKDGDDAVIIKMQREIQESKKAAKEAEKKLADMKEAHLEEMQSVEKEAKYQAEIEIIKRDANIAELHRKIKAQDKQYEKLKSSVQQTAEESNNEQVEKARLLEELKTSKESMINIKAKLTHTEHLLSHERKNKQDKCDLVRKLQENLEEAQKKIETFANKARNEVNMQLSERCKEIAQLKHKINQLEESEVTLQSELDQMQEEYDELKTKLEASENRIEELETEIETRDNSIVELPTGVTNELNQLRCSDGDQRREVDKLKMELVKANITVSSLEEQIQRDQQLLDVRSELINSLQTNDTSQRVHLEEMFSQVAEKNTTINELNTELRTKSEEFRNLFSTLSTKQLELARYEHMIKLLEENNERSQMLRVKQEEKIGRMEEEIARLKHTVDMFQENLSRNTAKPLKMTPSLTTESCIEYDGNLSNFHSYRRRKRHININVRKYEA